jgi:hypothetical protein
MPASASADSISTACAFIRYNTAISRGRAPAAMLV